MQAGNALLAMAGPVGWTIAGATLLSSILLFAKKRTTLNKQKNDEITAVKDNTERVREIDVQIGGLLKETCSVRERLNKMYAQCVSMYGEDYAQLSIEQKQSLGALVNNTKALSALLSKTVEQ